MSEKIRVMFSEEQVNEKIKELGAQISADTVSYTHLDVYKRQQHGSSRCKSSRAWRSSYGYRRADVRLMVHMSTNEYRLCDLFSLTNTGKTSINSL